MGEEDRENKKKIHIIQSDQLHEMRTALGDGMREIYFEAFWIRKWVGNLTHKMKIGVHLGLVFVLFIFLTPFFLASNPSFFISYNSSKLGFFPSCWYHSPVI